MEEGPEVTSAKLEETKSNEKDIKNCFEFENFETPDSIDFSGDSIEKTKVKMVSDSKSVANTDVQAGQALQLTIVLIYLNNNTRGKNDQEPQCQDGWGRSAHSQGSRN